jgi:hypothetical protein
MWKETHFLELKYLDKKHVNDKTFIISTVITVRMKRIMKYS